MWYGDDGPHLPLVEQWRPHERKQASSVNLQGQNLPGRTRSLSKILSHTRVVVMHLRPLVRQGWGMGPRTL